MNLTGSRSATTTAGHEKRPELPESIRARVANHPCFSEDAHHHYARIHVAVAPACNIQCHYCNRKYDCSNESRPGVVSELLTPAQAVRKVLAVAEAIPQLSVVGIAGPGDALANPERTFETFRLLREQAPDLRLCVSTNGLALPEWVDELAGDQVEHVTITLNAIDPEIGARIYPWIFWRHRRVRGRRAAEILIEQQLLGLERLVARGALVKVNSVLIPGVNDAHLPEVSRAIRERGAFLHNIMPLIARPEHGTFFGLMGQREPSETELGALRERCAGDMRLMSHCRQCRADAVGLLGEDRGAEFSLERIEQLEIDPVAAMARRAEARAAIEAERARARSAPTVVSVPLSALLTKPRAQAPEPPVRRLAVASRDGRLVDEHFGAVTEFWIYAISAQGASFIERRPIDRYCSGEASCGAGEERLARTLRALADCEAVLCARIGFAPWGALEAAGILPSGEHALEPVESALAAVYAELNAAASGAQAAAALSA
ncbi:MAG: nitrogenase cofactor biosynthesis protein NifB [Chromatiaceae bacterium]|nr:nitrogenase cofactor biosynthesis protein NifB [Chromatiaceae bacterium]